MQGFLVVVLSLSDASLGNGVTSGAVVDLYSLKGKNRSNLTIVFAAGRRHSDKDFTPPLGPKKITQPARQTSPCWRDCLQMEKLECESSSFRSSIVSSRNMEKVNWILVWIFLACIEGRMHRDL